MKQIICLLLSLGKEEPGPDLQDTNGKGRHNVCSDIRAPSASGWIFSLLGGVQERVGKHKHWGLVEFTQLTAQDSGKR